jgi:hypothetical protein
MRVGHSKQLACNHFHGLCPTDHFVCLAQRACHHLIDKIFSSFFSSTGKEMNSHGLSASSKAF